MSLGVMIFLSIACVSISSCAAKHISHKEKPIVNTGAYVEENDLMHTNPPIDICAQPHTNIKEEVDIITPKQLITKSSIDISSYEMQIMAKLVYAENGAGEDEEIRLIIDTILNRVESDKFPNTVLEVINQPNQYAPVNSDHIQKRPVDPHIIKLIEEEIVDRSNKDVYFYRSDYYHNFGTPVLCIGNIYFSTL